MIRRAPQAIIMAHRMDSDRRVVYVEGSHDAAFLKWLVGARKHPDAQIREIGTVKLDDVGDGGERGRLIGFATLLSVANCARIRCFADADFDRLLKRECPKSVWLTDGRDLEGYVLRNECVEKVLLLGIGQHAVSARDILNDVLTVGRRVGILRVVSEVDELALPFARTKLQRHLTMSQGRVNFALEPFLQALLQNAGTSLAMKNRVLKRVAEVADDLVDVPDIQIIHGKDAFCLIEKALSQFGIRRGAEVGKMLWSSFESRFVERGSNLDQVQSFLG